MISLKSLLIFLTINGGLLLLSTIHYFILINTKIFFILKLLSFIIKNLLFVKIVDQIVLNNKKNIKEIIIKPKEQFPYEFMSYLLMSSVIEIITFYSISKENNIQNIIRDLILFIPISFIFEIIFDFFHYWAHRIFHMNSFLYKNIHKTHHTHTDVAPIITFVQNPLDLILSNSLPSYLAFFIMKHVINMNVSLYMLICIWTYKSYIEIVGHADIKTKKTSSFVQCVWIPRLFNITLFSKHHMLHHSLITKNFSKRFSLWDKVFHTFKDN